MGKNSVEALIETLHPRKEAKKNFPSAEKAPRGRKKPVPHVEGKSGGDECHPSKPDFSCWVTGYRSTNISLPPEHRFDLQPKRFEGRPAQNRR